MWLLQASIRQAIEQAQRSGVMPTVEQQIQYEAQHSAALAGNGSRLLSVAGDTAEISIQGVITKRPSFFASLFGGGNTTFPEIISALAEADTDPAITSAVLAIDSPGGHFDGLFDTLAAIEAFSKPIKAVVSNLAASAAFAIAAQADEIIASNRATRFGSVGVVVDIFVDDNEVSIASTDAPKKRPDVTTDEGVAIVREELDALHEIFVEAIAGGRKTTAKKVNAEFGQGATLLAEEALKRGMIDGIAATSLKVVKNTKTATASSGGDQPETGLMDLNTLKAQHPDVYAAAVLEGETQERDRATAHLTMGDASGDMKTAIGAVKDGSAMTATLQSQYMAAGMARRDVTNRQTDDVEATAGDTATASDTQGDAGDEVANIVEARLGTAGEA